MSREVGTGDSAPAVKPATKRRRYARLFGIAVVSLAIGWTIYYYAWRYNAGVRRDATIAAARFRGEPIWFPDLEPDPLPAAEDGTEELRRAIQLHDQYLADGELHPYFQEVPYPQPVDLFDPDMPEEERGLLRNQIAAEAEVLALIHAATLRGRVQFARDYHATAPLVETPPEWNGIKQVSKLLRAATANAVHAGELDTAIGYIEDALKLENALRNELGLFPQLSRFGMGNYALADLAKTLARYELSDEQRQRLDALLAEVEQSVTLRDSVLADRAAIMTTLERMSQRVIPGAGISGIFDWRERRYFIYHNFRAVQLEDQVKILNYVAQDAEAVDTISMNASDQGFESTSFLSIIIRPTLVV